MKPTVLNAVAGRTQFHLHKHVVTTEGIKSLLLKIRIRKIAEVGWMLLVFKKDFSLQRINAGHLFASSGKDARRLIQGNEQLANFIDRIRKIEAHPESRRHAERPMQRLRAMVPGPDTNSVGI